MAENPLLPHRKLQELYRLMERCRTLEKKQRSPIAREAILAATSIHLEPGDDLNALDSAATSFAPESKSTQPITPAATILPRLVLAAATARGLQRAGTQNLVLAHAASNTVEPFAAETLALAQAERLPFILCIADAPTARPSTKPNALTWRNADHICRKLQLPTLTVDGEDAVALYRVMQEAALRARTGAGPSVIWAVLSPAGAKLTRAQTPIVRLQRYLAARSIPIPR